MVPVSMYLVAITVSVIRDLLEVVNFAKVRRLLRTVAVFKALTDTFLETFLEKSRYLHLIK